MKIRFTGFTRITLKNGSAKIEFRFKGKTETILNFDGNL
jgi:hypothetical protein